MHGEEARAYGDIGYIGASKRLEAIKKNKNGKKIKYLINKREHQKSSVCCKAEYVFAVIKNVFRYRKTRYQSLRN